MRDVAVTGAPIRLGQFLQLAGLADSGAAAKQLLASGEVRVNDQPENRRGRQLRHADVVAVPGDAVRVA